MGTLSRIVLTRNLLSPGGAPALWIGPSCCHSPSPSRRIEGSSIEVERCYSCKSETWYSMITDSCHSICTRKCFRGTSSRISHTSPGMQLAMTVGMILPKLSRARIPDAVSARA